MPHYMISAFSLCFCGSRSRAVGWRNGEWRETESSSVHREHAARMRKHCTADGNVDQQKNGALPKKGFEDIVNQT
ncbi:hypothetical protein GN956_G12976 [Arapaima gigas]